MEFPHRGDEERHSHHPHPYAAFEPNRGLEEGYHHRHPQYFCGPEEQQPGHGYEQQEGGYPPISSAYLPTRPHVPWAADPYDNPPHIAPAPFAPAPPGPYGSHGSSGPYYPHPSHHHEQPPASEAFIPSELPSAQDQPQLPRGQLVRVFCKKNLAFNLSAEYNGVIMKPANTQDEAQQWIKDESYGTRVKDNYGHSAFSLVNKKTGKILKHPKEKGHQVLLMEYRPDIRDDDILWSESQDFGEGFKTVRCASDTLLNLTVFEGAKTVRNGSPLVLDTWHKGDHQLWKLFPL